MTRSRPRNEAATRAAAAARSARAGNPSGEPTLPVRARIPASLLAAMDKAISDGVAEDRSQLIRKAVSALLAARLVTPM